MLRFRFWSTLVLTPALAAILSTAGCGGDQAKDSAKPADKSEAKDSGKKPPSSAEKTPLEATGVATLKGRVSYEGTPPSRRDLKPLMEAQQDKEHCLKGDTEDQVWIVGKDGGVANVVIWLRAPDGKYFKVPADQQKRTDKVEMDQPYCAFIPHVVAINPSFYDPETKKQKATGQQFAFKNSAPMNHNTTWEGSNALVNPRVNKILPTKQVLPVDAKTGRETVAGGEELLSVSCDIHKWMTAKIAVFDHPYYAVTDLNGNYEIKNAPAGAEVTVTCWHESMDSLRKAKTVEKITLKAGDTQTKDITIK